MKKLSFLLLLVVGLTVIGLLAWFYPSQPTTPDQVTAINRPPTWTNNVANELVIVQLDPTTTDQYGVVLEPFGRVNFSQIGETQTIGSTQLQLISVTNSSAQVLVAAKSDE